MKFPATHQRMKMREIREPCHVKFMMLIDHNNVQNRSDEQVVQKTSLFSLSLCFLRARERGGRFGGGALFWGSGGVICKSLHAWKYVWLLMLFCRNNYQSSSLGLLRNCQLQRRHHYEGHCRDYHRHQYDRHCRFNIVIFILAAVKWRKLAWVGHIMRHDSLSQTFYQCTLEGGWCRFQQRKCWMDNIKEWTFLPMPFTCS